MNEELKIIISAEVDKLKKNVEEAKKKVTSFKDEVKKASENVDKDFEAAGAAINNGMKVGAGALAGVATALLALGESTAEYRNEQAKLQTAFETAGASAGIAKDTYNDLYRVLGDTGQATEAAAHLAQLTTNEKELSEWANICQGVYATFGASLPIEGLTEAANETAKVGTVTGGLADALNWAGVSEEEFNEKLAACNTEAEREALIRETLSGIYDEAAANYEKNNEEILKQNEAQTKLNDAMAKLGEVTAPIMTTLKELAGDVLTAITPHLQSFAENYLPKIQEILGTVGDKLGSALDFLLQHKEILAVMAGIIGGVVVAIGLYNTVAAVKAAMDAAQVTTLGGLIAVHAAHAAAVIASIAPYLLIVAAIAAVIAIIVLCVKHWDTIKEACIKAWNIVKEKTSEAAEAVKTKIKEFVDKIVGFFKDLKEKITSKANEIKKNTVDKFNQLKTDATNKINEAKTNIVNKFNEMKTNATNKISDIKNNVSNAFSNIKSSITSRITEAKNSVANTFDAIKTKISNTINGARDTVKNAINKIKSFFNFTWSLPKLSLPKISIDGEWSFNPPSVPKFSVTWNALGGVFDKPTLFGYGGSLQGIGENGAEAVVPLENNLGWLDKLASMLSDRMGTGTPIIMQVDGKTFAEISFDSINQFTKQTGRLPIKLV